LPARPDSPERKGPSGPQPIASAIRQFLSQSGLRRPSGDERVFRAWSEAAGARWRGRAEPVAFRAGQLSVEVATSVHLAELKGFHGEPIRARANAALGETRIHKVVFKLKS
jgi:hypothetical protein